MNWDSSVPYRRSACVLEWAASGAAGVTIPGDVLENTGCGTYCHGLVGKVV